MTYSKIIGVIESLSKIPIGSTIGKSNKIFPIPTNDDVIIPTGDTYTVTTPLYKVKLIEQHQNGFTDDKYKNYPIFAERNCVIIKGLLYPYSLVVHHQLWTSTFGFPMQIQKIKELTNNTPKDHTTLIAYYLDNINTFMDIYNDDFMPFSIVELLEYYNTNNRKLIEGISFIDNTVFDSVNRCTQEVLASLRNYYHRRYVGICFDDIAYPHVLGRTMVDKFTLGYLDEPISVDKLKLYYRPSNIINLTLHNPIDKDIGKLLPETNKFAKELVDIINFSGLTDIKLRYILSNKNKDPDVKVEYCGNRFLNKKMSDKISNVIIKNIVKLLNNLVYENIDEVTIMKTFNDDVQVQSIKNNKVIDSWYWDTALSALCSNNLIVWSDI